MTVFCSVLACIYLLSFTKEVYSRSAGAPVDACGSLLPGHGTSQASGNGGYYIFSELFVDNNGGAFQANTTYDITLASVAAGTIFRGFLIQATDPANSNALIGTFTILDSGNSQTLTCSSDPDSTVTHTNSNEKTRISFQWTSPNSTGTVLIRYTIVTSRPEDYYGPLSAADNRPPCPFLPTEFGSHLYRFGIPEDCSGDSCDYYVGLNVNEDDPEYLDVYLDGAANGWVAVGFSMNQQMDEDDVIGCRVDSNNIVTAIDTWNTALPTRNNVLDDDQLDICMHLGSFENGRITCSFSRVIDGSNAGQDYNLNDTFYLLYGRRLMGQGDATNLGSHRVDEMNPNVSPLLVNPVLDENIPITPNVTCPPAPGTNAVYTFQFNNPGDDYYLTARVNPDNNLYLDIQLEGVATGWVAIGFSDNQMMENDDVIGCIRDPTNDNVAVVDTYNPTTRYGSNRRDADQSGVCTHETAFTDNRITCTFSRLIDIDDPNSRNLNGEWFLFFGIGTNGGNSLSNLPQHMGVPQISSSRVNIVTDSSASSFPRAQLLKVHGILMIITWPLLAVVAIFFAAWMRPALPNGEWFQIHRIFMVVALFTGALGFIFAFVANANQSTPGLISFACGENRAHFALGIIVFLLQIANPIIAIFRCAPSGERRWIFNLIHGTFIGFLAELLGLANVGIGIALFESGGCISLAASGYTVLWVYIGFVIFLLLVQFFLFMIFTLLALRVEPEKRAGVAPTMLKYFFAIGNSKPKTEKPIEMTDKSDNNASKPSDPPPRKPPSKDAPVRWAGLAVFMPVALILMLTCIILIIIQ